MRVVATSKGFDGITLREEGEDFDLPGDPFAPRFRTIGVDGKKLEPPEELPPPSWFKPVGKKDNGKKDGKDLV